MECETDNNTEKCKVSNNSYVISDGFSPQDKNETHASLSNSAVQTMTDIIDSEKCNLNSDVNSDGFSSENDDVSHVSFISAAVERMTDIADGEKCSLNGNNMNSDGFSFEGRNESHVLLSDTAVQRVTDITDNEKCNLSNNSMNSDGLSSEVKNESHVCFLDDTTQRVTDENDIEEGNLNSSSHMNNNGFSPENRTESHVSYSNAALQRMTDIVDIKNAFMEIHQLRMSELEQSAGLNKEEQNKKMLNILNTYIGHLEEQNDVLMTTVVELEREAQQRVQQMEKRLRSTAKSTMEAVLNINECEEVIRSLITQRLQIESILYSVQKQVTILKVENNFLRDQNFNLNHDIQALLHIIHRARSTGNWEMDCMMFCEVTPEQVFGPIQSMSPLFCDSGCLSHNKENSKQFSEGRVITTSDCDENESRNQYCVEEWPHKDQSSKIKPMELYREHLKPAELHDTPQEVLISCNGSVKERGGSLPSLDNLVLCDSSLQQSYSSKIDGICEKQDSSLNRLEYLNHVKRTKENGPQRKKKERPSRKHSFHKSESNLYCRQAYSEPLLFVYGDGVYVYKPCETVQKDHYVPPAENLINSLPYQSIDLTLPVEDVNDHDLSACEWNHTHSPRKLSTRVDSLSLPYDKDQALHCCCSSGDFEEMSSSKELSPGGMQGVTKVQDMCSPYRPSRRANIIRASQNYDRYTQYHLSGHNDNTSEPKRNGTDFALMCQYSQTSDLTPCLTVGTQTIDTNDENSNRVVKITENGFGGADVAEVQKSLQLLKQNLLRAEDKVHAKEILLQQLQNHLQTAFKEIELKDKALENIERKLNASRKEKTSLLNKISGLEEEIEKLSSKLKDAKMLSDSILLDVESRKEEIEELHQQEQVLQNQKRSLMIQLDTRCDELDAAKSEISTMKEELKHCKTQISQQTRIIQNLQEALVKSKRALDERIMKSSPPQTLSKTSHSSSSIVNI